MTENKGFIGRRMDFPSGIIIPWHGAAENIPRGWVFCDGNNGTPDLRGRYPKGVPDSNTDPGKRAGDYNQTISRNQLPSHSHTIQTTDSTSDHRHSTTTYVSGDGKWGNGSNGGYFIDEYNDYVQDITFNSVPNHSHNLNIGTTGEDESYDNEPRYKTLTFIMKV